jgi:hypothetical protein
MEIYKVFCYYLFYTYSMSRLQPVDIQKFYPNTPFTEQELQKLKSKVLPFSESMRLSWRLLQENFLRVTLFPFLWSLLVVFPAMLVFVILFTIGFIAYLNSSTSPSFTFSSLAVFAQTSGSNGLPSNSTLGIVIFLIIFALLILPLIYFLALIEVKQSYILNWKDIRGIWFIKQNLQKRVFKMLLVGIVYGIMLSLPAIYTIFNTDPATFLNPENTRTSTNIWYQIITPLLSFIPAAFLMYMSALIIYEDNGIIKSLQNSWNLVRSNFKAHLLRWGIFMLIFYVPLYILSIASTLLSFDTTNTGFVVISLVLSLIMFILSYVYVIVLRYFYYVTYCNLRFLESKS